LNSQLQRLINSGVRNDGLLNLPASDFFRVFIPLPPIDEQRRITEILRDADANIASVEAQIEAAQEVKRGVMQRLFRKIKGDYEPNWKFVKLREVCNLSTGTTPSTSRTDYYAGKNPFVKTAQIANNHVDYAESFVSDQALADYNLRVYPPGTLLMAMYGQGKTRGQVAILDIPASITQNAAAIEPIYGLVDSLFLWNYLLSEYDNLRNSGISEVHIDHAPFL
jgi:restriction endonuclease S subunit